MANYKVAYGARDNISYAIEREIIPPGCIILTEDSNEIFFYDLNRRLQIYESRNKFTSYGEAEEWVREHDCRGQIITILEKDLCMAYIVDHTGALASLSSASTTSVQADFSITNPNHPAYIKNKPTSYPISFIEGLEEILASRLRITNKAIPGALMIADSTGNIAGSDMTLQSLMSTMSRKVEIIDPIVEGALLVSDGAGGLKHASTTPQEIFSTLSKKVEIEGSITPGSLLVATDDGKLQCCGLTSSDIVLKEQIIAGSTTSTVTLSSSGVYIIKIPEEI